MNTCSHVFTTGRRGFLQEAVSGLFLEAGEGLQVSRPAGGFLGLLEEVDQSPGGRGGLGQHGVQDLALPGFHDGGHGPFLDRGSSRRWE